jgi:adenine-specific DNA-methyltransferase
LAERLFWSTTAHDTASWQLKEDARGPAGGFVYRRRQNNNGEEVGGIAPHVTPKSIANNEPPEEEVLVDRSGISRARANFSSVSTAGTVWPFSTREI